jgi:transcriptional regulator with XRE-family HTH domain
MINVGEVARELRESLQLTQQEMARELGISNVQLSLIENSKSFPSRALIDRFREKFEIDLYVLAWCRDESGAGRIPPSLRRPAAELAAAWNARFETIAERYRNRNASC